MKEKKQIISLEERKKIGQRIKLSRLATNLSRSDFCNKHDINPNTLFSIEDGRINITTNKIQKLLTAFTAEGVACTSQWLLEGKGTPAYSFKGYNLNQDLSDVSQQVENEDTFSIFKEVETFKQGSSRTIVIFIQDDAMMPLYKPGDYVGGKILPEQEILNFIGEICLIEIKEGEFIVRHLFQKDDEFILSGINSQSKLCSPLLKTKRITKVAKILWHRRPE